MGSREVWSPGGSACVRATEPEFLSANVNMLFQYLRRQNDLYANVLGMDCLSGGQVKGRNR